MRPAHQIFLNRQIVRQFLNFYQRIFNVWRIGLLLLLSFQVFVQYRLAEIDIVSLYSPNFNTLWFHEIFIQIILAVVSCWRLASFVLFEFWRKTELTQEFVSWAKHCAELTSFMTWLKNQNIQTPPSDSVNLHTAIKRSFDTAFFLFKNRFLRTKVNSRALVTTAFLNFDTA